MIFILVFCSILFLSCSEKKTESEQTELKGAFSKAIDSNQLQERGGEEKLFYIVNQDTPYTGWIKSSHENGTVRELSHYVNGKKDGASFGWYQNGQKEWEWYYKEGIHHGKARLWWENGQKSFEAVKKLGWESGLVKSWYKNGQKASERLYSKEGLAVSVDVWKPDGQKCLDSYLKEGTGKVQFYIIEGYERPWNTWYFKDGVRVDSDGKRISMKYH